MNNIFAFIAQHLNDYIAELFPAFSQYCNIVAEMPHNKSHGEVATNAAMVVARVLKLEVKHVANAIIEKLVLLESVKEASVAGAGFINIRFTDLFWHAYVKNVYQLNQAYGFENIGQGRKINLEFVSVNPTGPMHIGHARGAIYGDALSNILQAVGYDVTNEYYINDAGGQIDVLVASVKIRHKNLLGSDLAIPDGCYPGDYVIAIAQSARDVFGDDLDAMDARVLADFAVAHIMQIIKRDLADLGVVHDVFISEFHDIVAQGKVEEVLRIMSKRSLTYTGVLPAPKHGHDVEWEPRAQTIFRATAFGDDMDRPVVKSNGNYTYFLGDIAYHYHKLQRGFNDMILVLGADHGGYVKRIKAVVNALSDAQAKVEVKIMQLVNLYKNGQPFKMSKRAGHFITVQDVVREIGSDAFRFALLTKKSDTALDVDFTKLQEQSKDNPIFYVQYANTRAHSVLRRAKEDFGIEVDHIDTINMAKGIFPEDMELIKVIAMLPKVTQSAALSCEPHRLNYYLQDIANQFHQLWAMGTADNKLRFIDAYDAEITKARLVLVTIVKNVISNGLKVLGIKPLTEM